MNSRIANSGIANFGIAGLHVGHLTGAGTGVTVLLFPTGSVGSCEVRGGAPATRETDLLDPARTVTRVDAVVLAGGSAFGLAAADGVMRFLVERGHGFATAGGPVPIVPAACIFDLVEAGGSRPGPDDGYRAATSAAVGGEFETGRIGAGAGATVGKWRGREGAVPGGVGAAVVTVDGLRVGALAVVNALGDVVASDGTMLAGSTASATVPGFPTQQPFEEDRVNTTLVVVVTNAPLDKAACFLIAQSAHDGFAQALRPAHTRYDGDIAFAVATGTASLPLGTEDHCHNGDAPSLDRLRFAASETVAAAIRGSVSAGKLRVSTEGVP